MSPLLDDVRIIKVKHAKMYAEILKAAAHQTLVSVTVFKRTEANMLLISIIAGKDWELSSYQDFTVFISLKRFFVVQHIH